MTSTTNELTGRQAAMLAFERQWWKYAAAKAQGIRNQFDLTSAAYYQQLNLLIDRPAALAHDPALVRRLTRLREHRQHARTARTLGFDL